MDQAARTAGDTRTAARRLILLLDGTWNDQDFGDTDTNIVRLQEIIARTLHKQGGARNKTAADAGAIARPMNDENEFDNLVFYQRGVGTDWRDRYTGGLFGEGLDGKIRAAYRFLSFNYTGNAQVFVFGFSRGSYVARSLVGYIAAAGLLRREQCTPENEQRAWHFYRTPPASRLPGVWSAMQPFMHPLDTFRIECLGVFDTVGALGIPLARFKLVNRSNYEFHDVELSSITTLNLHAVALDEHRNPFEATLWRRPKFKTFNSITEQAWFPGVHSDIGGGYIPELQRGHDFPQALDDVTLHWMLARLTNAYPEFPADREFWPAVGPNWSVAPQHESRKGVYRLLRRTVRSIANYRLKDKGRFTYNGCYDRHAVEIGERVHVAALLRLGQRVERNGSRAIRYAPPNLVEILPIIRATYNDVTRPPLATDPIPVVQWSGDLYDPTEPTHCQEVLDLLDEAEVRLTSG